MRPDVENRIVYSDAYRYVLGPFIARTLNGDWILTFNLSVRREIGEYSSRAWLHPPYDPEYRNYLIRSIDAGATWEAPRVVPGYEWSGTEHVALCSLTNGDLLASFYQRKYFNLEDAEQNQSHRYGWNHRPPYTFVVTHGGTYVHRSRDNGRTWLETVEINPSPFISAYSPRNIVQLDKDTLIYTAGAADPMFTGHHGWANPPNRVINGLGNRLVNGRIVEEPSRVFICVSHDGGRSWTETREIAAHPDYFFVEPSMIRLSSGRLICHMRNCSQTGHLWQVISDDNGASWSEPSMTQIWGWPAHLVQLSDGKVLSVYGHRRKPYGIRACMSKDEGATWDYGDEIIIRDDLVNRTIGYPVSMVLDDDRVVTVYWDEAADGRTSVVMSTWRIAP